MPLSTVKRESLIPKLHLLSIALILTTAFLVLMPSRETFTLSPEASSVDIPVNDLDMAYLKARDASGDLSEDEMQNVIHNMIRGRKWKQARALMTLRPNIKLATRDQFLLDMETATAGYFDADNEARTASYKANLIGLMGDLFETPVLHDLDTLERGAEFSAQLEQPELSARYRKLLASKDVKNAAEHYHQCATVYEHYGLYGQSVLCFQSAITSSADELQANDLKLKLTRLHVRFDEQLAAKTNLESLVKTVPKDKEALERTAAFALEQGRTDLAYPLYATLSEVDSDKSILWLEKAAKWSEASNLPGLAAEYILTIKSRSDEQFHPELSRRRQKLLIAAGRNEDALQTINERIVANPDSGEELLEGITLAASMGLTQQAMEWNEDLLEIRPFDLEAMSRQVDYALASHRLEEALFYSKKLLEEEPQNRENRLRMAQLEEWTGNVKKAMAQRQWLAKNHPTVDNERELLRLAELNWDSRTAAETLQRISRTQQLSTEELQKLVKLYEQDGSPQLAASALENMLGGENDAMLLREVASLHTRHEKLDEALASWEQFANRFGRSPEESLNRMELLWRLKRPLEAVAVTDQITQFNSNGASQNQLSLMTELGWRYRKPELVMAAAPYLDQLGEDYNSSDTGRRLVQSLLDNNDFEQAIKTAENLWRSTDDISYLLSAIQIALQENIYPHYERFLDANGDLIAVREIPEYWLTVAEYHIRKSDNQAAIETYRNTLQIHPDNSDAMSGLIWTLLGENPDDATLLATLNEFQTAAAEKPKLWSAFAVGYLKANDAKSSLRWFSKLMAKNDNDYNNLLAFADALDQVGNATHAYRVRNFALAKLRPQVLAQASDKIDDLARDYISLLRRYGSAEENEIWTQRLIAGEQNSTPEENVWRQELAASWYLATQRNDYARLIMTKLHERRLESPAWQRLAVAMGDNDLPAIREILASSKSALSTGDEILALRKLGHERKAYVLAKNTVDQGNPGSERNIAQEHLISLRNSRPGYYSGLVTQREVGQLDITESGLSLRHTLTAVDLGFEVEYQRNNLNSDQLAIANSIEDDLAISAHFGNSRRGGSITAGVNINEEDNLNYTSGEYYFRNASGKRELTSQVTFNEVAESAAELRVGAKQDKAEVAFQTAFGKREFVRLSGNVNELTTRDSDERISRGVGGSIELGTVGSVGSNNWTVGVVASGSRNDREDQLPPSLSQLSPLSTIDSVLSDESGQLAISAAFFRGGIRSNYPQTASPRYNVSARFGRTWPSNTNALQVQAGAGFRVLGNDELSFQLAHDQQGDVFLEGQSSSTVGIQYRNHF